MIPEEIYRAIMGEFKFFVTVCIPAGIVIRVVWGIGSKVFRRTNHE